MLRWEKECTFLLEKKNVPETILFPSPLLKCICVITTSQLNETQKLFCKMRVLLSVLRIEFKMAKCVVEPLAHLKTIFEG